MRMFWSSVVMNCSIFFSTSDLNHVEVSLLPSKTLLQRSTVFYIRAW
jgi:hypothetical protein